MQTTNDYKKQELNHDLTISADKLNCKYNTQALELTEQKRLLTDSQKGMQPKGSIQGKYSHLTAIKTTTQLLKYTGHFKCILFYLKPDLLQDFLYCLKKLFSKIFHNKS